MNYLIVDFTPQEHKRIYDNIRKTDCWEWTGATDSGGYSQGFYRGKKEKVHRLVYASIKGPIPRGTPLQLDHLCKNKICVNPSHLELVTQKINSLRSEGVGALAARRSNCINGHPLRKEKSRPRRYCPTCDNLRHKKRLEGPDKEYWRKKQREATARYRAKHK